MTKRSWARAHAALVLWAGLSAGCDAAVEWCGEWVDDWSFAPRPHRSFVPPPPTHVRIEPGMPFDLGSAKGCVAEPATHYLAEKPPSPGSEVPQDAFVVRVAMRCESGQESLRHVRFTWVSADGFAAPATYRTTTPAPPQGALQRVFELPLAHPGGTQWTSTDGELRLRGHDGDLDIRFSSGARASAEPDGDGATRTLSGRCSAQRARLAERLGERFAQAPAVGPECNVLGWLVPSSCPEAMNDRSLLADALQTTRACGGSAARGLLSQQGRRIPDDLHLTLRRDRCAGALDRCPRYTLALFGNGATVMHGKHWVTAEGRSDGRTHPLLLAGLWQRLVDMQFLTRPGAFGRAAQCSVHGSNRGNLIRVEAEGKQRMLVDRDGCRGPFSSEELDALAAQIDAVAGVEVWTEARPGYADRNVQVWTVAL